MNPLLLNFVKNQGLQLLASKIPQILGIMEGTALSKSLLYDLTSNPLNFLKKTGIFDNKKISDKFNILLKTKDNPNEILNILSGYKVEGIKKDINIVYNEYSNDVKNLLKATGYDKVKNILKTINNPIELTQEIYNSFETQTQYIGMTIDLTSKSEALATGRYIPIYEQPKTIYGILFLSFQGKSPSSGKIYAYPNVGLDTWVRMNTEAAKGAEGSYSIFIEDYLGGGLKRRDVGSFYRTKASQLQGKIELNKYGNYKTKSIVRTYNTNEAKNYINQFSNYKKSTKAKKAKGS